jgi:hypothetical protein
LQRWKQRAHDVWNSIANDNTKGYHASKSTVISCQYDLGMRCEGRRTHTKPTEQSKSVQEVRKSNLCEREPLEILTEIAINPERPKHASTVAWNEFAPLNFELMTIKRMVQSTYPQPKSFQRSRVKGLGEIFSKKHTVIVKTIKSTTPIANPACRNAYGCPNGEREPISA